MNEFSKKYDAFLSDLGKSRKMVLSTAENNVVSSRMMSVVQIDGSLYFQTDITLRKYSQLIRNRNVALCIDNIQIEGIAEEIGHPLDCPAFCERFKECFRGSYDAYTSLRNERLFRITPIFVQRWLYIDGIPHIETFHVADERYEIAEYKGI